MAAPTSVGIGTGTAQVIDTTPVAEAFLQYGQEKAKKAELAKKQAQNELLALKDKQGWAIRDAQEYQNAYNQILNKYEGQWEQVYNDPAKMNEYLSDMAAYKSLIDNSNEQKELMKGVTQIYSNEKNKDPNERYYSDEQLAKYEDVMTNPKYLYDRDAFQKVYLELTTPTMNLKNPVQMVLEDIDAKPQNHLVTTGGGGYNEQGGYSYSYGNQKVDLVKWGNAVRNKYKNDLLFKASVDKNYGDIDSFVAELPNIYSTTDSSFSKSPLGGKGADDQLYVDGTTTEDFELETSAESGFKPWETVKTTYKAYTLPSTLETTISLGSDAIDATTGRKTDEFTGQNDVVITKAMFNPASGDYSVLVATTSKTLVNVGGKEQVKEISKNAIVPFKQVENKLIAQYGKEQVEELKRKLRELPTGDGGSGTSSTKKPLP
jgi:hypothetical protein